MGAFWNRGFILSPKDRARQNHRSIPAFVLWFKSWLWISSSQSLSKHKTSKSIQKQSNLVPEVVLRNKGKVRSDLWSTTSPSVRPSSSWFIYIWPKLYHFCLPEHIFSSRKKFQADFLWSCFQSKANNTYCRSFSVDLKNEIIFARQNRSGKIR